jgi:hypothetical protein
MNQLVRPSLILKSEWHFQSDGLHGWKCYSSNWWCDDGDGAELYVNEETKMMSVQCFSGIPGSEIIIDEVDFGTLLRQAGFKYPYPDFLHQCFIIAHYLCSKFCEWREL